MHSISRLPLRAIGALVTLTLVAPLLGGITIPASAAPHEQSTLPFTIRLPLVRTVTRWLQPTDRITPPVGCVRLTPGMNGVKVKLVQRRLGMPASTWETMDATTIVKV